jgi:hypothetical protein
MFAGSLGGVKSYQRKNRKKSPSKDDPVYPTVNFRGEQSSNQRHESKTDPGGPSWRVKAGATNGNGSESRNVLAAKGKRPV